MEIKGTKIYRVQVTLTGATVRFGGVLLHTVPDEGDPDRHLEKALNYLKDVEGQQWVVLKKPFQVGLSTYSSSVPSEDWRVFTLPVPE